MPRLFLHIGYPKTGTTALQRFLAVNQERLRERGILYPEAGKLYHQDIKRFSDAHYATTFALGIGTFDRKLTFATPAEQQAQLAREVADSGCGTLAMTSEYFITSRNPQVVREFFADYDTTIVVYLRRHDDAYESSYNQAMKNAQPASSNRTIEAFILYQLGVPDVPYDYLETLDAWANAFGQSNIIVRPFEKMQIVPDIYTDFLHLLGVEDLEGFERPPRDLNTSVSHRTLCAIRAVRRSNIGPDRKGKIIARLINAPPDPEPAPRYLASPMRNAIVTQHRASYVAIARKYLGREDGLLFRNRWPTREDPWAEPVDPTPDELLDIILAAAAVHMK